MAAALPHLCPPAQPVSAHTPVSKSIATSRLMTPEGTSEEGPTAPNGGPALPPGTVGGSAYLPCMSDETSSEVTEAAAVEARVQGAVDEQVAAVLERIADGLPTAVNELAKRIAHEQVDNTKRLGLEGLRQLKNSLSERSAALAADLRAAAGQIEWPVHSHVRTQDVHSALFTYLYGRRVGSLASVLKEHGFDVRDDNAQRSQSAVLPQSLYDQNSFGALADALSTLSRARNALASARQADDRDIVEDLWGSS